MIANNLEPSEPTHPGELLKEEIEYRGISQKKLAEEIGISYKVLNDILNCRRPVTHPYWIADGLQHADSKERQVFHGTACQHKENRRSALTLQGKALQHVAGKQCRL